MASNKINIVIQADDKASKPLRNVSDEMDRGSGKASRFKSALGSLGGMLGKATLAAGAMAVATGVAGGVMGFKFNSSVEQAETKLMAFTKNSEKVAKTLKWVKSEAALTQFSFTEMADAAANLTPVAKSSGESLESLIKQAEILAALNPAEGLTGATFSLREALSGDFVSLMDRFNIPRKRINELKAQGVPAMEIIRTTLKEMGIDYSLVAKQGQTTAARFDQIKDKLVMMAGAAARPIFQRVSRELDVLGSYNYQQLGENLGNVMSGAIHWVDELVPKVQELGKQVWDYLGPKFSLLWGVISRDLTPSLERLWKEVIQPMLPVLGVLFVGALGLAIDALSLGASAASGLINMITWLTRELRNGNPVVWTLAGAFGGLGAAMMLGKAFSAVSAGLSLLTTRSIPAAMLKLGALRTLIGSPIVMPAIVVAAAIAAIQTVSNKFTALYDQINKNEANIKQAKEDTETIKRIGANYRAGKISRDTMLKQIRIVNGHALGTNASAGGVRWVGEHGPEPIMMPQGARVLPNYRARQMSSQGGGATVIIQTLNNNYPNDDQRLLRDIGFALETQ